MTNFFWKKKNFKIMQLCIGTLSVVLCFRLFVWNNCSTVASNKAISRVSYSQFFFKKKNQKFQKIPPGHPNLPAWLLYDIRIWLYPNFPHDTLPWSQFSVCWASECILQELGFRHRSCDNISSSYIQQRGFARFDEQDVSGFFSNWFSPWASINFWTLRVLSEV